MIIGNHFELYHNIYEKHPELKRFSETLKGLGYDGEWPPKELSIVQRVMGREYSKLWDTTFSFARRLEAINEDLENSKKEFDRAFEELQVFANAMEKAMKD